MHRHVIFRADNLGRLGIEIIYYEDNMHIIKARERARGGGERGEEREREKRGAM